MKDAFLGRFIECSHGGGQVFKGFVLCPGSDVLANGFYRGAYFFFSGNVVAAAAGCLTHGLGSGFRVRHELIVKSSNKNCD